MISVKDAISTAASAVVDSFGVSKPRLEEIMRADDEKKWQVTLSFLREIEPDEVTTPGLFETLSYPLEELQRKRKLRREFRTVTVDSESGDVKAIQIREVHGHVSPAG